MERLLSEGEIAETWKSNDKGFITDYISTLDGYYFTKTFSSNICPTPGDYDMHEIASVNTWYNNGLDIIQSLTIHGTYSDYSIPLIEKFINEYKIEPYTYEYYIDDTTTEIPAWIKPFSILTSDESPCNLQSLPFCVVYIGNNPNVKSALNEYDENMEYEIARRLQSIGMKSAMH